MILLYIIFFSLLGSVGAIALAFLFFAVKKERQKNLVATLISFATGTLLASAFLGLIPHALENLDAQSVFISILAGLLFFFTLEKFVIWYHCHTNNCENHKTAGSMILVGDAFHNLVDGVVIASSFLVSVPFGIAVSISIILHEIPQELGDLAILIHSGYTKKKALLLNIFSGLISLPAAIVAYFLLDKISHSLPYILAIAAASFIYIALTDLSPELHKKSGLKNSVKQLILFFLGTVVVYLLLKIHH